MNNIYNILDHYILNCPDQLHHNLALDIKSLIDHKAWSNYNEEKLYTIHFLISLCFCKTIEIDINKINIGYELKQQLITAYTNDDRIPKSYKLYLDNLFGAKNIKKITKINKTLDNVLINLGKYYCYTYRYNRLKQLLTSYYLHIKNNINLYYELFAHIGINIKSREIFENIFKIKYIKQNFILYDNEDKIKKMYWYIANRHDDIIFMFYITLWHLSDNNYFNKLEKLFINYENNIRETINNYPLLLRLFSSKLESRELVTKYFNIEFIIARNMFHNPFKSCYNQSYYIPNSTSFWKKYDKYFIQNPKTGSQSISNDYYRCGYQFGHMFAKDYPIEGRRLVISCRNPYTRLLSGYNFMMSGGHFQNVTYVLFKYLYPTFEEFVINGLNPRLLDTTIYYKEPFFKQSNYWRDDIPKENIIRFENLKENCKRILGPGLKSHYNRCNFKKKDNIIFTEQMQDKIYNLYKEDFDIFGYDKKIEI